MANLGDVATRVFNMISRAVIKAINDTGITQQAQLEALDGDVQDDVPVFQQYGFNSVPFPDAEAIVLYMNGNRSQGMVLVVDGSQYRPADWEPGEVGMYTDEDNSDNPDERFLYKLARGKIHKLEGEEVHLCGDDQAVVLEGKLKSYIDAQVKGMFNGHTHTAGSLVDGLAAPVTGVTGGPSTSIASAGDISSSKAKAGL